MITNTIEALTPVERHGNLLLKRDDYYVPFDDIPLNGGKVRQTMALLSGRRERIIAENQGVVISATSTESPQGVIVARCANHNGLKSIICFGGTSREKILKMPMYKDIEKFHSVIDTSCKVGYTNVVQKHITDTIKEKHYFYVKFGINLEEAPEAILGAISRQCENIPRGLDSIVVPVGSAITLSGVLLGLKIYDNYPKTVYGVQIAGHDYTPTINRIVGDLPYKYIQYNRYPYHQHVNLHIGDVRLDPVYEAKAYNWYFANRRSLGENVLFWIVGNTNNVRNRVD